ncbi:MAG: zinc ribbon domain-containing protein [Methanomicrobiales archaeon]|nr:zinc ribbon domain-containing protein [Methanomicrobiales archaeon]
MTPSQHFCGTCGSPLKDSVRFCTQCGASLAQQVTPLQPGTPVSPEERVLGAIAGLNKSAFLKGITQYALIVTPRRLIVAVITDEMQKAQVAMAAEQAKAQGSGFFGQAFAKIGASLDSMTTLRDAARGFLPMDPEAILRLHSENFAFPREEVTFVTLARQDSTRRVVHHTGKSHHQHTQHTYHYHFVITTTKGAFVYDAPYDARFRDEILAAFPGIVQHTG